MNENLPPDSEIVDDVCELPEHPEKPCEALALNAPVISAKLQRHVFVCNGKSCTAAGGEAVLDAMYKRTAEAGLLYGKRGSWEGSVIVTTCGSVGFCQIGPTVIVYPDGVWYFGVKPEDVDEIVISHLVNSQPVERLIGRKLPA